MILDLPSTDSAVLNRKLIEIREQGGTNALGRVLTLVIVTDEQDAELAIDSANAASFEHPCRVIVLAHGNKRGTTRMDGQIRVGGDAGASEVVVLRLFGALAGHGASVVIPLLLPDAPVVVWWPDDAPAVPADDPVGALGQRRITDLAADGKRLKAALNRRRAGLRPGDTDLAWTRITRWRGLLAAVLDQPPYTKVDSATVWGAADSPSVELMAAWLAERLRVPVQRKVSGKAGSELARVELRRKGATVVLERRDDRTTTLIAEGKPEHTLANPRRSDSECLAEELRRLDNDEVFDDVMTKGLDRLLGGTGSKKQSART